MHIALGTKPIFPFCSGIPPISISSLWDESLNRHKLILNDLFFFMIFKELSISVFFLFELTTYEQNRVDSFIVDRRIWSYWSIILRFMLGYDIFRFEGKYHKYVSPSLSRPSSCSCMKYRY